MGIRVDSASLRWSAEMSAEQIPFRALQEACARFRLDCTLQRLKPRQVERIAEVLPVLGLGSHGHSFLVVAHSAGDGGSARIGLLEFNADNKIVQAEVALSDLLTSWEGSCIVLKRQIAGDESDRRSVGRMISAVLADRELVSQIITSATIMSVLALAMPLFFQAITNKVIPYNSHATLLTLCLIVILVLLANAIMAKLRSYFMALAVARLEIRFETTTFAALLRLPIAYFENSTTGLIARQVQQTHVIKQFLGASLLPALLDSVVLCAIVPVAFVISWQLTLLILAFGATLLVCVAVFASIYRPQVERLLAIEGRRQTRLVETIRGIQTVKALVAERQVQLDWNHTATESALCNRALAAKLGTASAVISLLERLTTVGILTLGAELIFEQRITLGALVAIQMLAGNVSSPLTRLAMLAGEFQKVRRSIQLVNSIFDAPPERLESQRKLMPKQAGQVEFRNVGITYPGGRTALADVSFEIKSGSIVAVVGPSGSGKTTISRLVQGSAVPQHGSVRFDGVDLRDIDLSHHRSQIGVVLQHNYIFRASVAENIAYGLPHASTAEIVEAARAAGVLDVIAELPNGFDTILEEDGANLSGGQRQRIAIARALLRKPKILLFDEATSALDAETEEQIIHELRALAIGRTVILITHRLAALTYVDHVMLLRAGRLEAFGTRHDVVASNAGFRELCAGLPFVREVVGGTHAMAAGAVA
jgi:ATP-binding cassette subfamily B protein